MEKNLQSAENTEKQISLLTHAMASFSSRGRDPLWLADATNKYISKFLQLRYSNKNVIAVFLQ